MQPDRMVMRYPATRWQDALPTGSGIVGAMLYGQIVNETILLNHDALYYPRDKAPLLDVSHLLPELRRCILQGRYTEAERLLTDAHALQTQIQPGIDCTSKLRAPYQPFGAIRIHTPADGVFRHYRRGIDFATGRIWAKWQEGPYRFLREVFVSRLTDTIFVRLSSTRPDGINGRITIGCHHSEEKRLPNDGWHGSDQSGPPKSITSCPRPRLLHFDAEYPGEFSFGAVGVVSTDTGECHADDSELVITGAHTIVLQVRLYLAEKPADALNQLAPQMEAAVTGHFDKAFEQHAASHGELYRRVCLQVAEDLPEAGANEDALLTSYEGDVPDALILRLFSFGRYLLICSSRQGGWPANLQGVWNGDYAPAWNSDIHTDENIQMNYWQALPGGMPETLLPFFDYFESFLDDYRRNARCLYGCRGILIPIAQTTHGLEYPGIWSHWTGAAGWIARHFYDYYLFTGDLDFLRTRAVPWLKEVALFYEDFLHEDAEGTLCFSPSMSPENVPSGDGMSLVTMNATMDVAICRDVLQNLCDACERLDIDAGERQRWQCILLRLPVYEINEEGALKEWLHPRFKDHYHHRHQSHLYPLFPGLEFTRETHSDLFEACRIAVEKRLVIGLGSQTGWSMAHMANIYARLGEGDRALECLHILARSSVGPNLFTYHNDWRQMGLSLHWSQQAAPPFQIDANLGITAAVLEMLLFSQPGFIKILPALPSDWNKGRISGIRARGGICIDLQWDLSKGEISTVLFTEQETQLTLAFPSVPEHVVCETAPDTVQASGMGDHCRQIHLEAGKRLAVRADLSILPKGVRSIGNNLQPD